MGLKEVLSRSGSRFQIEVLIRRAEHRVGEDRRPAGAARRLSRRLPQPRPGDRDHPHRGRAQAGDDRRIRADRPPGRGDPQHAPAQLAPARGDAAPKGERDTLIREREELQKLIDSPGSAAHPAEAATSPRLRERYGPETALGRRRTPIEEAAPAREIPLEAMIEREPITVIMSKRGWIRAMKGHVELAEPGGAEVQGRRRRPPSSSTPRPPTSCCSPRPTAASTRSPPTGCPAGAASASRSS